MLEFFDTHSAQFLFSAVTLIGWLILKLLTRFIVRRRFKINEFSDARRRMVLKSFGIILNLLLIAAIVTVWSVKQEDVLLFLSSIVTVLGVAFFAQWSHLSNITSGVILFLSTSTKIGDYIRIMDKDFDLEGEIFDIGLVFFKLRNTDGEIITLPNNIILQKAVKTVVLRKEEERDQSIGTDNVT